MSIFLNGKELYYDKVDKFSIKSLEVSYSASPGSNYTGFAVSNRNKCLMDVFFRDLEHICINITDDWGIVTSLRFDTRYLPIVMKGVIPTVKMGYVVTVDGQEV